MKTMLLLGLALAALNTGRAEVFRSRAGDRGDARMEAHRSEGGRDHRYHRDDREHRDHRGRTSVHVGIGYGRGPAYVSPWRHAPYWQGSYGYYSPVRHVPAYGYYAGYGVGYPHYNRYGYYGPGSYSANGLVLGALAGGIIGNNSGTFNHSAWRGAAWGAGVGWLLGTVADAHRRPVVYESGSTSAPASAAPVQAQPVATPPPQQVTIINNYYNTATPMSDANRLFGR